jgi:hypothetical protein
VIDGDILVVRETKMTGSGNGVRKASTIVPMIVGMLLMSACYYGDLISNLSANATSTDGESTGAVVAVDVESVWMRIHDRGVLEVSRYETRAEWRATQQTSLGTTSVVHSMRMRATVDVRIGINLENVSLEDIVVDDENQTVTVTLPQTQPIECFIDDIEYFDRSCVVVCGDLERTLREEAMDDVLESEELAVAMAGTYEEVQSTIVGLIDPLANDYDIFFVQDTEIPLRLDSSSCD